MASSKDITAFAKSNLNTALVARLLFDAYTEVYDADILEERFDDLLETLEMSAIGLSQEDQTNKAQCLGEIFERLDALVIESQKA